MAGPATLDDGSEGAEPLHSKCRAVGPPQRSDRVRGLDDSRSANSLVVDTDAKSNQRTSPLLLKIIGSSQREAPRIALGTATPMVSNWAQSRP
jgi:hypothetical protein